MSGIVRRGALIDFDKGLRGQVDLFICSASFEARCLSISEHLDPERVGHVVIAMNRRFEAVIQRNYDRLRDRFAKKETTVVVDSVDPVFTTRNIVEAVRSCRRPGRLRVVIDITTFTHEALLILFRVCDRAFTGSTSVDFVYASAEEYSLGDEAGQKWLSKGISEVRSVMGYPGALAPSRKSHLVILAGFEDYRALSLVRELEPALVSIGYGDRSEHGTRAHQEANEKNVVRIRRLIGNLVGTVQEFVFSCYDVVGAERAILEVVADKTGYNTVLAPMNTKMSTLGAGGAALRNETIQICYAQADMYNVDRYSSPGSEFYRQRLRDYPTPLGARRGRNG